MADDSMALLDTLRKAIAEGAARVTPIPAGLAHATTRDPQGVDGGNPTGPRDESRPDSAKSSGVAGAGDRFVSGRPAVLESGRDRQLDVPRCECRVLAEDHLHPVHPAVVRQRDGGPGARQRLTVEFRGNHAAADAVRVLHRDLVP